MFLHRVWCALLGGCACSGKLRYGLDLSTPSRNVYDCEDT